MDQLEQGVIAEAAVQPDLSVPQPVPQSQQEQLVPVSALQAERRERQQLQENLKLLQDHVSLLQANQAQVKPQEEFQNLSDNDVLTVGEAKKFIQNFSKQQNMAVEELKMSQNYPDYNEVVRKYIPEVLKNDPDLKDVIMNAPNPYRAAYYIAKRSDAYLQDKSAQARSPQAQQAIQNLQKPGNLAAVGQGVTGTAGMSYKQMSDKDFAELANKNMGYV
ncbi:hypothetical protein UFOVP844_48 [uncultured Caudovirales phage]|uniref:Uncharacterized protein n=1 Tax=uncultured Caudovirales phage TaxID=2100421 RepID=A0A6J5P5G2_9CAUD|nr:hypothetical protein UFOVP844_48 [uncultured Caudovirales phage]